MFYIDATCYIMNLPLFFVQTEEISIPHCRLRFLRDYDWGTRGLIYAENFNWPLISRIIPILGNGGVTIGTRQSHDTPQGCLSLVYVVPLTCLPCSSPCIYKTKCLNNHKQSITCVQSKSVTWERNESEKGN